MPMFRVKVVKNGAEEGGVVQSRFLWVFWYAPIKGTNSLEDARSMVAELNKQFESYKKPLRYEYPQ